MNSLLLIAIKGSIAASNVIMNIYNKDFDIAYKEDLSPLTEADQAANAVIMDFLIPTGIPIVSEENKNQSFLERKKWKQCWIVDPLDGTKEFIKKNGEFTVNIALIIEGKPQLGVIFVPVTRTLYFGNLEEKKAYKIYLPDSFKENELEMLLTNAISISPNSNSTSLRVVGSRSHMNTETVKFIENLKKNTKKPVEIISKGSSLKLCLIAEGEADIYPRFAPTMEWDIAAGHAICAAVGLKVVDISTEKEMWYNKENLLNNFFLVSNGS